QAMAQPMAPPMAPMNHGPASWAPAVPAPTMAPMQSPSPSAPVAPPRSTAEETVIRMSPYTDLLPTSGEATMMHSDLPAHALVPGPVAAPQLAPTPRARVSTMQAPMAPGLAPMMPLPMGPGGGTQAIAAPPPGALEPSPHPGFGDDPFGTIPPPAGSTEVVPSTGLDAVAAKLKTTRRTLVLGGA